VLVSLKQLRLPFKTYATRCLFVNIVFILTIFKTLDLLICIHAAPSAVLNVQVDDVTDHLLVVTWTAPAKTNGRIKQCEVLVTSVLPDANGKYETKKSYTTQDRLEVSGLRAGAEYRVKVLSEWCWSQCLRLMQKVLFLLYIAPWQHISLMTFKLNLCAYYNSFIFVSRIAQFIFIS